MLKRMLIVVGWMFWCSCLLMIQSMFAQAQELEIVIHYQQSPEDQEDWKIWLWSEEMLGEEYSFDGKDPFGKVAVIKRKATVKRFGFLLKNESWKKEFEEDRYITNFQNNRAEIWLLPGHQTVYERIPDPNQKKPEDKKKKVIFHYQRPDGRAADWVLWYWTLASPGQEVPFVRADHWGQRAEFEVGESEKSIGFVLKKPGLWVKDEFSEQDRFLELSNELNEFWASSTFPETFQAKPQENLSTMVSLYGYRNSNPLELHVNGQYRFPCERQTSDWLQCPVVISRFAENTRFTLDVIERIGDEKRKLLASFEEQLNDDNGKTVSFHLIEQKRMELTKDQVPIVIKALRIERSNVLLVLDRPATATMLQTPTWSVQNQDGHKSKINVQTDNQSRLVIEAQLKHELSGINWTFEQQGAPAIPVTMDYASFDAELDALGATIGYSKNGTAQQVVTCMPNATKMHVLLYRQGVNEPKRLPMIAQNGCFQLSIKDQDVISYQYEIETTTGSRVLADPMHPLNEDGKTLLKPLPPRTTTTRTNPSGRKIIYEVYAESSPKAIVNAAKQWNATTVVVPLGISGQPFESELWYEKNRELVEFLHQNHFEVWMKPDDRVIRGLNRIGLLERTGNDGMLIPPWKESPFFNRMLADRILIWQQSAGYDGVDLSSIHLTEYMGSRMIQRIRARMADQELILPRTFRDVQGKRMIHTDFYQLILREPMRWFNHMIDSTAVNEWLQLIDQSNEYVLALTDEHHRGFQTMLNQAFVLYPESDRKKMQRLLLTLFQRYPGSVLIRETDGVQAMDMSRSMADPQSFKVGKNGVMSYDWQQAGGIVMHSQLNLTVDPIIALGQETIGGLSLVDRSGDPAKNRMQWMIGIGILMIACSLIALLWIAVRGRRHENRI